MSDQNLDPLTFPKENAAYRWIGQSTRSEKSGYIRLVIPQTDQKGLDYQPRTGHRGLD